MSEPTMEICSRCKGHGEREVILTNGQKETRKCWMCDGAGKLPVFPKKFQAVKSEIPKPVSITRKTYKKVVPVANHLTAPMGDLSWLKRGKPIS